LLSCPQGSATAYKHGWALLAIGNEFAFEIRTNRSDAPITYFSGVVAAASQWYT
jgi:hypothetical protein